MMLHQKLRAIATTTQHKDDRGSNVLSIICQLHTQSVKRVTVTYCVYCASFKPREYGFMEHVFLRATNCVDGPSFQSNWRTCIKAAIKFMVECARISCIFSYSLEHNNIVLSNYNRA